MNIFENYMYSLEFHRKDKEIFYIAAVTFEEGFSYLVANDKGQKLIRGSEVFEDWNDAIQAGMMAAKGYLYGKSF